MNDPDLTPAVVCRAPASSEVPLLQAAIVLRGLHNPRGLRCKDDGSLLLVEAGRGDAAAPFSGRLLHFAPDGAGGFLPPRVLADGFRSMNMQARMCRDEIFGLADVAFGGGRWLMSQTDYVDGSRIYDVSDGHAVPLLHSRGNLNALCYHPMRQSWLTVKPDTNQVVEFPPGQPERVVGELPTLADGQNAVPVSLVCETGRDSVLVSLFTGELGREPHLTGIEFVAAAGSVQRLDLANGRFTPVVTGLTLPTGLGWLPDGRLLVLELCQDFLQPMPRSSVPQQAWHGGFRRHDGRLLACDLQRGHASVLLTQLDTPSNLCVAGERILISEGMGIPGRTIPGPNGAGIALEGFVRQARLAPA